MFHIVWKQLERALFFIFKRSLLIIIKSFFVTYLRAGYLTSYAVDKAIKETFHRHLVTLFHPSEIDFYFEYASPDWRAMAFGE